MYTLYALVKETLIFFRGELNERVIVFLYFVVFPVLLLLLWFYYCLNSSKQNTPSWTVTFIHKHLKVIVYVLSVAIITTAFNITAAFGGEERCLVFLSFLFRSFVTKVGLQKKKKRSSTRQNLLFILYFILSSRVSSRSLLLACTVCNNNIIISKVWWNNKSMSVQVKCEFFWWW